MSMGTEGVNPRSIKKQLDSKKADYSRLIFT